MANTKISALTSATTPLAGTEVLPIVQSSTTVKVATNDLTVRNVRANATTGILQVTGPTAATTRVMTVPDANFTAARTDAAQSLTGDQTLSAGNIVQGTAAKGFNFTANTPQAGVTGRLLNWYEEGSFTPVITATTGAITSYTATGKYVKVGQQVTLTFVVTLTNVGTASGPMLVAGMPFTVNGTFYATAPVREFNSTGVWYFFQTDASATTGTVWTSINGGIVWLNNYKYVWSVTYIST